MLWIVLVVMALKADDLLASPRRRLDIVVPLLLYALNYLISTFVARLCLSHGEGTAEVYGTVMRNLSIALALAMNAFGEAGTCAALMIALVYNTQVQSAAWYVCFSHRLSVLRRSRPKRATRRGCLPRGVMRSPGSVLPRPVQWHGAVAGHVRGVGAMRQQLHQVREVIFGGPVRLD